jgi:uroporphyrinogen decarboxylase
MDLSFQPDYKHIVDAALNRRPARLPIYEHVINTPFMEKVLQIPLVALLEGDTADRQEFFRRYCGFYRRMTYDTVSYEICVTEMLPGGGALLAERTGPIQNRSDFEEYPWSDLPRIFWDYAEPRFEMLGKCMPPGMKAVGGIGNGVFEISEDLVGFEQLCYIQVDDPELFADLFVRIGKLLLELWAEFLRRHGRYYAVCRIGDDMGFKTGTLLAPQSLIVHVIPQYRRILELIHSAGFPFLLHSCGCIFDVMDALLDAGIGAKHSNEDVIAPFEQWIDRYGQRIGLFGGIDTDLLCRLNPEQIYELVLERGTVFRALAQGFALGSGNSIPEYVPVESYMAMIQAAQEIRRRDGNYC